MSRRTRRRSDREKPSQRRLDRRPIRRYRRRVQVLAGLLATLVAMGIGEITVRVLQVAPAVRPIELSETSSVYQRSINPILGYELKANWRQVDADPFKSYATTNAHGQRDVERTIQKPPGVQRVILLGDSVVAGHGIAAIDDLISRQIEQLDPEQKTEVLNFGVSGYCTLAEVELLRVKGVQFDPDTVVLLFVANDFENYNPEAYALDSAVRRPWIVKSFFQHLHLFRLLCLRLNLFQFAADADPVQWNQDAIGDNNVVEGLQRLAALADQHGFDPIIAIWPTFNGESITNGPHMEGSSNELVIERLAQMVGIKTARLSPYFEKHRAATEAATNPRRYYTTQGDQLHPNRQACQIAAGALKAALDELARPGQTMAASRTKPIEDSAAIAAAQAQGAKQPEYVSLYNNLGADLQAQGKLEEAMDYFRRALEIQPDAAEVLNNVGTILLVQGKQDQALEYFGLAVRSNPDFAKGHFNLGRTRHGQNQLDEAIGHYRRALEIDPDNSKACNNLGSALLSQGKLDEAAAQFQGALQIQPHYVRAHYNLAMTLQRQAKLEAAAMHYRRAAEGQPDFTEAHSNLGMLLQSQGKYDEAIASFRRALQIQPDAVALLNHVARLLAAHPDPQVRNGQQALQWAQHAARLTQNINATILDTLAMAYAEIGQFDRAAETAKQALDLAKNAQAEQVALLIAERLQLYRQSKPYRYPASMDPQ